MDQCDVVEELRVELIRVHKLDGLLEPVQTAFKLALLVEDAALIDFYEVLFIMVDLDLGEKKLRLV